MADQLPREVTPPPNANPCQQAVDNTPVRRKLTAHAAFAVKVPEMKEAQEKLVTETQGHYIGPMPPHLFFDEFMPWNDKTPKKFRNMQPSDERIAALQAMDGLPENKRYTKIIDALSGWPQDDYDARNKRFITCPLVLKDSHSYRDKSCSLGVDITGYHPTRPRVPRNTQQTMDFANAEVWNEDKASEHADAFVDGERTYNGNDYVAFFSGSPSAEEESEEEVDGETNEEDEDEDLDVANDDNVPREEPVHEEEDKTDDLAPKPDEEYPFENSTVKGSMSRGQMASYAGATMASQYRGHLFSTFTFGRYARFIRWDRSAAIVSARFDFVEHPTILFDFYKRFSQLSEEQRGIDPNVKPATRAQGQRARKALKRFAPVCWTGRACDLFKKQVDIATMSFLRMRFEGSWYITAAPYCDSVGFSPFGRSSRARTVVPDGTNPHNDVLYMKDYFREESLYTHPEAQIYRLLKEHRVEHVAEMMTGGDSDLERTIGHTMTGRDWVAHRSRPLRARELIHHVLLLKTIGRSLITFRTARDLVTCIADAMEGHRQALEKCSILHRDISAGNILMTLDRANRRGFLIDWDHCVVLSLVNTQPRITRVLRTGTWQFLSARLAEKPHEEHTALDDRESCLHVLMWCALRYLEHNLDTDDLVAYLDTFDAYLQRGTRPDKAGPGKRTLIISALDGVHFDRVEIQELIVSLCNVFSTRYKPKPVVPRGATARQVRMAEDTAGEWEDNWASLNTGEWLPTTLRRYADQLPVLEDEQDMDWINNGEAEGFESTTVGSKRRWGRTDLRNALGFDGMAHTNLNSLNPTSDVVEVPPPPTKRQRKE